MKQSKLYKAVYADEDMEIFCSSCDDDEVFFEAKSYETDHGILFDLFEIDEHYEEIRSIF